MANVTKDPVEGTKQSEETVEQEEAKSAGISPDSAVLAQAPDAAPTPEQLANPDVVKVQQASGKKSKAREFKIPSSASTEHFAAQVRLNGSGVEVVVFRKQGSVGDDYEVAASQLNELIELLQAL